MTILHDPASNRYICQCSFMERHIPKAAGFHWDPVNKTWWTDDPTKAATIPTTPTRLNALPTSGNALPARATPAATPNPSQQSFGLWRELPRRPVCPFVVPPDTVETWPVKERMRVTVGGGGEKRGTVEVRAGDWIGARGAEGRLFVVKAPP